MTTGKTTALTIWAFVNKVIALLFNMQSMLLIAFIPRSKHLLISWLPLLSAVILEAKKTVSVVIFFFFSFILHEVMGPDATILIFLICI